MAEPKLVTIQVDGRAVAVPAGSSVVDAAHKVGVEIPIFCHHPRLEPVGMCRMCLVDVGTPVIDRATGELQKDEAGEPIIRFFPKLQAGCTMQASEGMVVRTETEAVADARRSVLEFLLTSHPLDCPVCDKGGECPLQNQTMRYGPGQSRFAWREKFHFVKPVPIGPLIALDRERCVLCARCIRFEDEIAGDQVLGFENRSRGMEIVSFSDPPFDSYFSGNTSDICPVGALTTKDFRFEARAWEVVGQPSVCGHCSVGCNSMLDTRFGEIERVMPRANEGVNEIWLCDKGRFAHHHAASPDRLMTPLVREDGQLRPASWEEALGRVAERLGSLSREQGPASIGGIAGAGLANEDLYLFGRLMRAILGTNNLDHRPAFLRDDIIARAGLVGETRLTELGAGDCVVVAGLDVEEEAPVLYLNLRKAVARGARLILLGAGPQKLDAQAEPPLRYQLGDEGSLLAGLIRSVLDARAETASSLPDAAGSDAASSDTSDTSGTSDAPDASEAGGSESTEFQSSPDPAALADLRAALESFGPEALGGRHPVRAEDLAWAAAAIAGAERLIAIFGRQASEAGLAAALETLVAAAGKAGQPGSGLIAVGPKANSQGAADMGVLPNWLPGGRPLADGAARAALGETWPAAPVETSGLDAEAMLAGGLKALYLVGTDPAGDDPRWVAALEKLDFLVVQELFLTPSAARADVVLPALSSAEREGSYTSLGRRLQRFAAARNVLGQGLADWRIFADLGQRLGAVAPYGGPDDILDEIASLLPGHSGLNWASLGAPAPPPPSDMILPFAPQTEARSVSYEGTAYSNLFGEGRCWDVAQGQDSGRALAWRPDSKAASGASPAPRGRVLRLLPTRRVYDAGRLLQASRILAPLVPPPLVEIGIFDATELGLAEGDRLRITGPGGSATAEMRLREGLTPGVILAPESLDWDLPPRALTAGRPWAEVRIEKLEAAR